MADQLQGRVIAVTGGASGIGLAISAHLRSLGVRVAALDVAHGDGAGTADKDLLQLPCDVTSETSVRAAFGESVAYFGRLDGLVNNAGIMVEKPLDETTLEDFDRVISVNLRGVFLCGKVAVEHFRAGLSGDVADDDKPRIVNIASELAHLGRPEYSAYCASKGGVVSLTRAWARELAPNILVNALAPGPTDTSMLQSEKNYHAWVKTGEGIPLGRVGRAEDIATATAFLLGRGANFMTGSVVDVNGGAAMY